MASRRGKKSDEEEKVPQNLILAEKWAKRMGKNTEWGKITTSDGKELPILGISHGPRWVYIRNIKSSIVVFIVIDDKVRDRIKTLDQQSQEEFLLRLKYQALSNARTGWIPEPSAYKNAHELERIHVQQEIRISKEDPSSYNRLSDAIQEVVTVGVRIMTLFGILTPQATGGDSTDQRPPPDGMYA